VKVGEWLPINRGSVLSPRIRYNPHDQGGIANYTEMQKILSDFGIDIKKLGPSSKVTPIVKTNKVKKIVRLSQSHLWIHTTNQCGLNFRKAVSAPSNSAVAIRLFKNVLNDVHN
jgi:hypothetical protein